MVFKIFYGRKREAALLWIYKENPILITPGMELTLSRSTNNAFNKTLPMLLF